MFYVYFFLFLFFFFFFQAEDGIRDVAVTGVQTCALPILGRSDQPDRQRRVPWARDGAAQVLLHHGAYGPLHPPHVAHVRSGLRPVGHEPDGVPPHESPPVRRERGGPLSRFATSAREGDDAGGPPPASRSGRGDALLRPPSPTPGIGRLGGGPPPTGRRTRTPSSRRSSATR